MILPQQKPGRSKQDYGTPPALLEAVKKRLHIDEFDLDLAASAENAVYARYYDEQDDARKQPWLPRCRGDWNWLNPPFAKLGPWVMKAAKESRKGAFITMLLPASVGSNWFAEWVAPYAYVSFLNPRLTFVGETHPYPKDLMIAWYTPYDFIGHDIWRWQPKMEAQE